MHLFNVFINASYPMLANQCRAWWTFWVFFLAEKNLKVTKRVKPNLKRGYSIDDEDSDEVK